MTADRGRRLRELFDRLIDLPDDARARLLDRECAGDAAMRRELEELLAADMRTGDLRVPPVTERIRPLADGTEIGFYRLSGFLGEGGFAEVYIAEQSQPLWRRVALKVLKAGMDTRAVLARFEAERQALALMDHPGIARVYDAGETERGRPFFVMELVEGERITSFADGHRLTIRERLELFIAVAHAVQHAHQKGIIHRDLKPSNVLVSEVDRKAAPKIIDFGIAKAMNQALSEQTLFTEEGQLIGTPEYMSPEQADTGGVDIDTRTDIYSLGVLLYELLTGSLPFDADAIRRGGLDRIRQTIREEEPPRPSTHARHRGNGAADAAWRRRTEPGRLARQIRGDLDWIVLKAMARERERRYESASALADDIRRFLDDQPVAAGPPSIAYRMRKFGKRHRVALAITGVVVASLLFAVIESNRQRIVAERARAEAVRARDESEAVAKFLSDMLAAADPRKRGRDISVREILDEGVKTIGTRFEKQPLVRAKLMTTMGIVYEKLGSFDQSKMLLEEGLALREKHLGPVHADVAYSLNSLAVLHQRNGDYAESRRLYERALSIWEATEGPEGPNVATCLNNLGNVCRDLGDYAGARSYLDRSLAIRERIRGPDHLDVAQSLNNIATLLATTGDHAGARAPLERALAIREKNLPPDHPDIAQAVQNLGAISWQAGDTLGAVTYMERALAMQEKKLGPRDLEVALSLSNLGAIYATTGDTARSRQDLERALDIEEEKLGRDHPDVARTLVNLAELHSIRGDVARARSFLDRAAGIHERTNGGERPEYAATLSALAALDVKAGSYAEAKRRYENVIRITEKTVGPEHPTLAKPLEGLAGVTRALGDTAGAGRLEARARALANPATAAPAASRP